MKYIDGQPVEAYLWRDFIRLGAFHDGEREYVFNYEGDGRLPYSMTVNGGEYALEYDQVGTLKAVVSPTGNVVKAIQYDVFGNLLWDSNPGLRIPLGFAGGLSDPDTDFVRFGWRDYDPDTGRWTAPDPIGDAGGDDDWYGYCLDDPVNAVDPLGLFLLGGLGIATGLAALGSAAAGLMADGAGAIAGKNKGNPFKATKGVMKGMAGAAAVNAGLSAVAVGATGAAKAATAIGASAPTIIRQGKHTLKNMGGKAKDVIKAGIDYAKTNPDKVDHAARVGNDITNSSLPPETDEGKIIVTAKEIGTNVYDRLTKKEQQKDRQNPTDWWGR